MYSCPSCSEQLPTEQGMHTHHALKHGESISRIESLCDTCGTIFEYYPKRRSGTYCSIDCNPHEPPEFSRSGEDHPSYNSVKDICDTCGSTIKVTEYERENYDHHFCSNRCYGDYRSELVSGSGNPMYIDDSSRAASYYTGTWNEARRSALRRDNFMCQECGKNRDELGMNPDVHHIEPVRTFEDPQEAHNLNNLICLCKSCHRKEEEKTKHLNSSTNNE